MTDTKTQEQQVTDALIAYFPALSPAVFHYGKAYPAGTDPKVVAAVTVPVPLRFFMAVMADIAERHGEEIAKRFPKAGAFTDADEVAVNGGE